jgi:hypothetical protein
MQGQFYLYLQECTMSDRSEFSGKDGSTVFLLYVYTCINPQVFVVSLRNDFDPEDRGSIFLWNVLIRLQDCAMLQLRRLRSELLADFLFPHICVTSEPAVSPMRATRATSCMHLHLFTLLTVCIHSGIKNLLRSKFTSMSSVSESPLLIPCPKKEAVGS